MKFKNGYARVYCGGHIIAQIVLKDNPIEIASRPLRKCPECDWEVGIHGCEKHHKEKATPKVKVEWGESDGICRSAGWFLIPPEGYAFEVQMDECGCKPYNVKLVEADQDDH